MLWFNVLFFLLMTFGSLSKISTTTGYEQSEYFWFGLVCATLLVTNIILAFHS